MPTVALLGPLDAKGKEYDYRRTLLRERGVDAALVDAGIFEPLVEPDVPRSEVAAAAGADVGALANANDRGAAVETMGRGAAEVVRRLHAEGRLDGILSIGGSGNAAIAAEAMRGPPLRVPKPIVTTIASGGTRP